MATCYYDVAIIGSGFAGSLLAMILRRQGRSVILLEKGKHPRFAIGESSTPLSNLLLEELCSRYDLPQIAPLTKWGTWQQTYPDLDCGLKRGFTFYHHQVGRNTAMSRDRENQLLVEASPNDDAADTHWYRADVDHHFVREAEKIGVDYRDEVELTEVVERNDRISLSGQRLGSKIDVIARFVVDATGPRGFLHRSLGLSELEFPGFPPTQALYTHFSGVARLDSFLDGDDVSPPYPPDDAAVHHVFDGGWIWVLRFRSGITSAGVAAIDSLANQFGFSEGAPAWQRLLQSLPVVGTQFKVATAERPFIHTARLAFRSGVVARNRWALLPSAAGFVDPLLSTGFPLVLWGVARLAAILEDHWESSRLGEALADYTERTTSDLLAAARLVGGLYHCMDDFPLFTSLSMLYFATASFSEAARRLGKLQLADSFLLHAHPLLKARVPDLIEQARFLRSADEKQRWRIEILRAIGPFNIGGFGQEDRRNWYAVKAEDLLQSASELSASPEEITHLLIRSGFQASDVVRTAAQP